MAQPTSCLYSYWSVVMAAAGSAVLKFTFKILDRDLNNIGLAGPAAYAIGPAASLLGRLPR